MYVFQSELNHHKDYVEHEYYHELNQLTQPVDHNSRG